MKKLHLVLLPLMLGIALVGVSAGGVEQYYRMGFIDTRGNIVIKPEFDKAFPFQEGMAVVGKRLGDGGGRSDTYKWGAINKSGKLVIPMEYDNPQYDTGQFYGFSEGLLKVARDGKYGFINMAGRLIIGCQFDDATGFHEGLACVRDENKKYGFINKSGKTVIPFDFSWASDFSEGLAKVTIDKKEAFIDKNGKVLFTLPDGFGCEPYIDRGSFKYVCNGLIKINNKDTGKYGFMNTKGNIVISPEYEKVYEFSEGLAAVKKNGLCGFIDKTGKVVIPLTYKHNVLGDLHFKEGLARIYNGNKFGYINRNNKAVIPFVCHELSKDFNSGMASDYRNGGFVIMNSAGKIVKDFRETVTPHFYSEGLCLIWVSRT